AGGALSRARAGLDWWTMRLRSPARFLTLPVAVGASIGLLLLLGTLQYQWVGQLADAERAQIRAGAQARAQAMARDFRREVTHAFLGLHLDPESLRGRGSGRFAERYDRWRARAAHPALVKAVYLVEPSAASTWRLSRFDPATRGFAASDWPPDLAGHRERVEACFRPFSPGIAPGPLLWRGDLLDEDLPAFTFPILSFPAGGPGTGAVPISPPTV